MRAEDVLPHLLRLEGVLITGLELRPGRLVGELGGESDRGRGGDQPLAGHVGPAAEINGDGARAQALDGVFGDGALLDDLRDGAGEGVGDVGDEVFGLGEGGPAGLLRGGLEGLVVGGPQSDLGYFARGVFFETGFEP